MLNIEYKIEKSRGLMLEENLIFEKERSDHPGVDLPAPKGFPIRTGLEPRKDIGLHQITEPQTIRHFVRLSTLNYSIDTGIFPLGSCTMKHNPRINEKLARLPGLSQIHPLQNEVMVQGALELMYELQTWLSELSGLNSIALSPAAGAHGELAGMLVIKKAHDFHGRTKTKVLVPDGAHGTNPATAAACGYKIVTIPSSPEGLVDMAEFEKALDDDVAALMLTNPNTCGLFEKNIVKISAMLKQKNAYFYCDGANFNAIVGKVRPADFGVDVMHFNLHKTFSTPHGGGGPGCGPIGVTEELAPFLPLPLVIKEGNTYRLLKDKDTSIGRLKSFNGQFGMFVRALSYMLSHGKDGLKQVAEDAVLNANYVLARLKDLYHAPFGERCMHECLITAKYQKEQGVSALDIAKNMIEHAIHPMTIYFPLVVMEAMLIEPTETETKASLDNLISIMRKIASEAKSGNIDHIKQNPQSAPRKRLDEVTAARNPVLRWKESE